MVPELFISFAPEDEELARMLEKHLMPLVLARRLTVWHRGKLLAGTDTDDVVGARLAGAQVMCPVVTASYFAHGACVREMEAALERLRGGLRVAPVLGRACSWEVTQLGALAPLPPNRMPVKSWASEADALDAIVKHLEAVLADLQLESTGEIQRSEILGPPGASGKPEPETLHGGDQALESRFREQIAKLRAEAVAKRLAEDDLPTDPRTDAMEQAVRALVWPPNVEAVLVVVDAADLAMRGKPFPLQGTSRTIGRSTQNDIVFEASGVSRQHARVERRKNRWHLVDLGSRNGTSCNDVSVIDHVPLQGGEWIGIGPYTLRFLCGRDTQMQLEQEIRHIAMTDGLTGAFNKSYFLDTLALAMRHARHDRVDLSILCFDIDDFEAVNAAHGPGVGSMLLKQATALVRLTLGQDARCLARLTGDQFAVIVAGDGRLARAVDVAERLCRQVDARVFVAQGDRVHMTISVGVATLTDGTADALELLGRAEEHVRLAKRLGKNRVSA